MVDPLFNQERYQNRNYFRCIQKIPDNVSLSTINLSGPVFSNNTDPDVINRSLNRRKLLIDICKKSDITLVQESWLTGKWDDVSKSYTGNSLHCREFFNEHNFYSYFNNYFRGTRGTMVLVRKEFLTQHKLAVEVIRLDNGSSMAIHFKSGNLNFLIFNIYLPAHAKKTAEGEVQDGTKSCEKIRHINNLSKKIPSRILHSKPYMIFGGDFNFVESRKDRIQLFPEDGSWNPSPSSANDSDEILEAFSRVKFDHNLIEVPHTHYTYKSHLYTKRSNGQPDKKFHVLSRLDRFYVSDSPSLFLSHNFSIEHHDSGDISDHNHLCLSITKKKKNLKSSKISGDCLKNWAYQHQQFPKIFADCYKRLCNSWDSKWCKASKFIEAMHTAQKVIKSAHDIPEARTPDQRIGVLCSFIRHIQSSNINFTSITSFGKSYPKIREFITIKVEKNETRTYSFDIDAIEKDLKNLFRKANDNEIEELKKIGKSDEDFVTRKMTILDRLKALKPIPKNDIEVIFDGKDYVDSPSGIADAVLPHFEKMFQPSNCSQQSIDSFLHDFTRKMPEGNWQVTKRIIQDCIRTKNSSHPGPGGIPFAAWSILIEESSELILDLIEDLTGDSPEDIPPEFQLCYLFLVPKSPDLISPDGRPAFSCGKIRPVMVAPTIIRLISQCLLRVLAPKAVDFVHSDQKGFVPGRQGIENIYKCNNFFYKHTQNPSGSTQAFLLLVDFSNAFSCLDWRFIKTMLLKIGIPEGWTRALCSLLKSQVDLQFKDVYKENFVSIGTGCRQGDPLSGILFAIFLEPLLQKLRDETGDDCLGFADDLILLLTKLVQKKFGNICLIFKAFGEASNLRVNLGKTVAISCRRGTDHPMHEIDVSRFKNDTWPNFGSQLRDVEKYLGVKFGRKINENNIYDEVMAKFDSKLLEWDRIPASAANRAFIANIFLISLFSYISQVCPLNSKLASRIKSSLKRFFSKIQFCTSGVFWSLASTFDLEHGHFIRDPYLWSLATFLRATANLKLSDLEESCHRMGIYKQLVRARDEYKTLTDDDFPHPDNPNYRLLTSQSRIYGRLYKSYYANSRQLTVDKFHASHPSLSTNSASVVIDSISKIYRENITSKKQRELIQAGDRFHPGPTGRISRHHIFNSIKFYCNGIATKKKMSKWKQWSSPTCRFCPHEEDSIQHWLGIGQPRCRSVVIAAEKCSVQFCCGNLFDALSLSRRTVIFLSAVIKAHQDFHNMGRSSMDPTGLHICSCFHRFMETATVKPNIYSSFEENSNDLNRPTVFQSGVFLRIANILDEQIISIEYSQPISLSYLFNPPPRIDFFISAITKPNEIGHTGYYGFIALGIQILPVSWSGAEPLNDEKSIHPPNLFAIERILDIISTHSAITQRIANQSLSGIYIWCACHLTISVLRLAKSRLSKNPSVADMEILVGEKINNFNKSNRFILQLKHCDASPWRQVSKNLASETSSSEPVSSLSNGWLPFQECQAADILNHIQ